MGYHSWPYQTLQAVCSDVFRHLGFNGEEADFITDVLLTSDLYGIETGQVQAGRDRSPGGLHPGRVAMVLCH